MSLGHFIFPNFYMKPPSQIYYPPESEKSKVKFITRQYHKVYKRTYKKWRLVNRISIVLDFCSDTFLLKPTFVIQNDGNPNINKLQGVLLRIYKTWFNCLSLVYKLPKPIYKLIWGMHSVQVKFFWQINIMKFHLNQMGVKDFVNKILQYAKRKIKK